MTVWKALFDQLQKKALGPDRLNFSALGMLWCWDVRRVTALIRQYIRIGYHTKSWKRAIEVMLRKPNKLDHMMVKSYRVIRLFNYFMKVCERIVADLLTEWCEIKHVLHRG